MLGHQYGLRYSAADPFLREPRKRREQRHQGKCRTVSQPPHCRPVGHLQAFFGHRSSVDERARREQPLAVFFDRHAIFQRARSQSSWQESIATDERLRTPFPHNIGVNAWFERE